MIQNKEKIKKIYDYLSTLSTVHASSNSKNYGWSLYNESNKKLGFSVEKYEYDDESYNIELVDVDFNHSNFWPREVDIKRIVIRINILRDFSRLKIVKCKVKDDACLVTFFKNLDDALEKLTDNTQLLTDILLKKGE